MRKRGIAISSFERADTLDKSAAIFQTFQPPYLMRIDGRRSVDDIAGAVMDVVTRGLLVNAVDDGLVPLPPEQVGAATVSAGRRPEAVRRAIERVLGQSRSG